ncbi:thioredoxin family protein [Imtechella halotolerans]|uniref:Thioredoxin-like protein n=1 Tax=Imtechella halotolerans K1 TaxID=946077 RepID=I0WKD5_9FLAO|nr:thioredoxin family protein [Imtechella halotolerans]EID76851.1 thioredoxin-like protein [Imtechella halotolerans K1]WMQ62585.1 thioredoxin family protein [Imtechella halotolerans]
MEKIIAQSLENGMTYQTYRALVEQLLSEDKATGPSQSPEKLEASKLNHARMNRLDKTTQLENSIAEWLQENEIPQTWLVITEGWCGDAAHVLPVLNKFAENDTTITLSILLRDDNEELMDRFLTNGTRSIPKLIILNADGQVMGHWGPRTELFTQKVTNYKAERDGKIDADFKKQLQLWYNEDKGKAIQHEVWQLMQKVTEMVTSEAL